MVSSCFKLAHAGLKLPQVGLKLAQVGPSWLQDALRRHFCQKADFSKKARKTNGFCVQCFCSLRWHLKRPKIATRRSQGGLKEVLFRCSKLQSILVRFRLHFGSLLGVLLGPKRVPKINQIRIPDWRRLQDFQDCLLYTSPSPRDS